MMNGMMGGGFIWASLVSVVMVFGFAYVVYVLANKEAGMVKTIGQVIAAIVALAAVVMLFYGVIYGGMICGGSKASKMMDNPQMNKQMMEMQKMMEKYNK